MAALGHGPVPGCSDGRLGVVPIAGVWLALVGLPVSPQCPLDSAAPHLAHGLRPMEKDKWKIPYVQAQRSCLTALLCTAYASTMYGYVTSRHGTLSSLMVLGLNQRYMLISLPALSLVPDALAPPNGCWPITAPVGLSLM